jgi:hypothetical protein
MLRALHMLDRCCAAKAYLGLHFSYLEVQWQSLFTFLGNHHYPPFHTSSQNRTPHLLNKSPARSLPTPGSHHSASWLWLCLLWVPPINGILQYLSFCVGFISLGIIFSSLFVNWFFFVLLRQGHSCSLGWYPSASTSWVLKLQACHQHAQLACFHCAHTLNVDSLSHSP